MAPDSYPPATLRSALERIGPSDHLCMSYRTRQEQLGATMPFIQRGLERNEQCVVIADDASGSVVLSAMEAAGIDVRIAAEGGAPSILGKQDTYLSGPPRI